MSRMAGDSGEAKELEEGLIEGETLPLETEKQEQYQGEIRRADKNKQQVEEAVQEEMEASGHKMHVDDKNEIVENVLKSQESQETVVQQIARKKNVTIPVKTERVTAEQMRQQRELIAEKERQLANLGVESQRVRALQPVRRTAKQEAASAANVQKIMSLDGKELKKWKADEGVQEFFTPEQHLIFDEKTLSGDRTGEMKVSEADLSKADRMFDFLETDDGQLAAKRRRITQELIAAEDKLQGI